MASINLKDLSKVINLKSLSFDTIKNDLLAYIEKLPEGTQWKDFHINTSDGNILLTLLSGIAAFKAYNDLSISRESSLDYATIPTNVFNLASNRGYLIPPSYAAEVNLYLKLTSSTQSEVIIKTGDIVASLGNYNFYSLGNYQISSYITSIPIKCAYGYLNVFNQDILDNKKNNVFSFSVRDKYVGSQLESFSIDNIQLELTADSSIYSDATMFLLRRILYYTSKIYLGNGTIGYYNSNAKTLQYSCISYDIDILDRIDQIPTLYYSSLILDRKEILLNPSFEPDIEQVRNISRFYPIDGRIVQDQDYVAAALKYFGDYLYDVLSYNSDTDQEVTLLIKNSFTPQTQTLIQALFASRMALGIRVNIYTKQSTDGKTFTFNCNVNSKDAYSDLYSDVINFVNALTFKFLKADQTVTAANLCLQLSAKFGIVFTPTGTESITVLKDDFFSAIDINITLVN